MRYPLTPDRMANIKKRVCVPSRFSCVRLFASPRTVALQAPLSMGFSRQEYWSGLPCPPPGALPKPGIKPISPVAPALQVDSLLLSHQGSPQQVTNIGKDVEKREPLYTVGENVNWYSHYGKRYGDISKKLKTTI